LSSSGAIQLSITSILTSLQNATQLTLFSPDTRINASGTSAVATTIGNGVAGGTLLLNNLASELRGSSLKVDSSYAVVPFDFNFFTSTTNPTVRSANIDVSGGGATANQGTITIASATTNLNSTTTNCNGIMNFNSDAIVAAAGSLLGVGSLGNLILYEGDATTNTGLTTFNGKDPATDPTNSVLIVQTTKIAATICNLSTNHRDGFIWYLANQGQSACTVNYGTSNIFGPGLTRTGTNTCNIPIGGSRMFRSCVFPTNTLGGGFTNGWFTVLL
jgi:hypothetical protein